MIKDIEINTQHLTLQDKLKVMIPSTLAILK